MVDSNNSALEPRVQELDAAAILRRMDNFDSEQAYKNIRTEKVLK